MDKSIKKTVMATFTGRNGSLGYKTNERYRLTIWQNKGNIHIRNAASTATDLYVPTEGYCEYESITAFLSNWDTIRVVEQ